MRVGITQRVEYMDSYKEFRDCLDQRWSDLLDLLKLTMVPIPNRLKDLNAWLEIMKCDAYILTGGNDLADLPNAKNISKDRDRTEIALLNYALSRSSPVFGVCRGLQLMNIFLGGQLDRVYGHVANRHLVSMCFNHKNQYETRNVNSFHEWGIATNSLSQELIPCAFDTENNIEAARHRKLNWLGIMWHPEREKNLKKSDTEIIRKIIKGNFV